MEWEREWSGSESQQQLGFTTTLITLHCGFIIPSPVRSLIVRYRISKRVIQPAAVRPSPQPPPPPTGTAATINLAAEVTESAANQRRLAAESVGTGTADCVSD